MENATKMAAKVVGTFGDDWELHYADDGSEVSCRTDIDIPCEGAFVEIFSTSQWPDGLDDSPVAEFLAGSIVMLPRLIGEVERLAADRKAIFSPNLYLAVQQVLDKALGTGEEDGAGAGIVADITLVVERMQAAESEVDRLKAERDKAAEGAKHMGSALTAVGVVIEHAIATAESSGPAAGMNHLIGYMSDANMLPEPAGEAVDG